MKTYNVTVRAIIVQTIPVEAESKEQAAERALELFDVDELEFEVSFDKEVINMEKVK